MRTRIIEVDSLADAKIEIATLGCAPVGVELMAPKALLRILKIKGVRAPAANIIKQEMLSFGGEAANAYGAINCSVKETEVIIMGTIKHLRLLTKKLKTHQFGLPQISKEIEAALANYDRVPPALKVGHTIWNFALRTYVMGILNVTPDSFSDGGMFLSPDDAVAQAERMFEAGADIIDIGAESTRPGAKPVTGAEEIKRAVPVIKKLKKNRKLLVSIDTRKSVVAKAALEAGADLINDVSGLRHDRKMASVAAKFNVPICLMHMRGTPANMQKKITYRDLIGEIIDYLDESLAIAENAGILLEKIIVDPGFGFGKTVANNLEIVRRLREFKVLGRPILIGPSRKSTIGKVLDLAVSERLEGTAALVSQSISNGANIVRVHDVKEIIRVCRMTDAIVKKEKSYG